MIFEIMNMVKGTINKKVMNDAGIQNGILNPNSKITGLILWLYTIEPPLYYYVNETCRKMDMKALKNLGPYIRVLFKCLRSQDIEKHDSDMFPCG